MNILIKSFALFLFYCFTAMFFGCQKCACDEQAFATYDCYKLRVNNDQYSFSQGQISVASTKNDTVKGLEYGITLVFEVEKYAKGNFKFPQLIPSAYACECPTYSMRINDKIKKIEIYTMHPFNESYPAGSNVTSLFYKIDRPKTVGENNLVPVDSSLKSNNIYEIPEFSYGLSASYYLNERPETCRRVQFKITATFESGKVLTDLTTEVVLR